MQRSLLVVTLATAISGLSYAQTPTTIPILNAGFEADVLSCAPSAGCFNNEAPAWVPAWYNPPYAPDLIRRLWRERPDRLGTLRILR
jgi:hypothetical protein